MALAIWVFAVLATVIPTEILVHKTRSDKGSIRLAGWVRDCRLYHRENLKHLCLVSEYQLRFWNSTESSATCSLEAPSAWCSLTSLKEPLEDSGRLCRLCSYTTFLLFYCIGHISWPFATPGVMLFKETVLQKKKLSVVPNLPSRRLLKMWGMTVVLKLTIATLGTWWKTMSSVEVFLKILEMKLYKRFDHQCRLQSMIWF